MNDVADESSEVHSPPRSDSSGEDGVPEPGAEEAENQEEDEEGLSESAQWFVLHTFAGQEEEVRDRVEETTEEQGLDHIVKDVVVPSQEVVEIKQGEKEETEQQLYPGYVFIKMVMTDEHWHTIRQIRGVMGFVGTESDPIPVEDTEMGEVLSQIGAGGQEPQVEFAAGDTVRIISGAMEEMTGTVKEVDIEKTKLHVSVDMFGRSTPVELDFDQAEKL